MGDQVPHPDQSAEIIPDATPVKDVAEPTDVTPLSIPSPIAIPISDPPTETNDCGQAETIQPQPDPEPASVTVPPEDGEMDLLGSLEAVLDNHQDREQNQKASPIQDGDCSTLDIPAEARTVEDHDDVKDLEMTG
jgi:hypothetical protein